MPAAQPWGGQETDGPVWPSGPPIAPPWAAGQGQPSGPYPPGAGPQWYQPVPPRGGRQLSAIPARAAWWGVAGFAVAYVLASVGAAIGLLFGVNANSSVLDLFSEPGLWAGMLLTVIFVSRRYGTGSLARDFGLSFKAADPLRGLVACLAMYIVVVVIALPFSGTKFSGSNTSILSQQKGNSVAYVLISVMVAVGAPFFEELFFRGFLRTALTTRWGPHGAIFGQAIFFGLAHAGEVSGWQNVSVVLALAGAGVVLGYAAYFTGRLVPGMVAHCLFNLVAVISIS